MLLWFGFGVSGIVPEVLKMLVFPTFLGLLWGGLFLFILGLEGFGVFCVSCVCFCFCVAFVSVLFALFLFCCWIVFGVGSCSAFVFVFLLVFCLLEGLRALYPLYFLFLVFLSLGGFKGQVRWPKGPPHLALNPPYFLLVFFCFFYLLSFLCF